MTGAFQSNAFESDAFQETVTVTGTGGVTAKIVLAARAAEIFAATGGVKASVTQAGVAKETFAASGAIAAHVRLAASGNETFNGTAAIAAKATLAATGKETFSATGAVRVQLTLAGIGAISGDTTGTGGVTLRLTLDAQGNVPIAAVGADGAPPATLRRRVLVVRKQTEDAPHVEPERVVITPDPRIARLHDSLITLWLAGDLTNEEYLALEEAA